ncbi:hypothetical protein D623_10013319 [Myotis brandtii]|uniref:Uncharacterized protein n=1 Tax=Myotis brandtii TaxID=109478 RepID=S7N072_MYOBR|nr:hypothetical protein D623_10013319 [Myotis brandtii]
MFNEPKTQRISTIQVHRTIYRNTGSTCGRHDQRQFTPSLRCFRQAQGNI